MLSLPGSGWAGVLGVLAGLPSSPAHRHGTRSSSAEAALYPVNVYLGSP